MRFRYHVTACPANRPYVARFTLTLDMLPLIAELPDRFSIFEIFSYSPMAVYTE